MASDEPSTSDSNHSVPQGEFEREFILDRQETADFLTNLGNRLDSEDEVAITGHDWKIPLDFMGPVGVEIEYEGPESDELAELEIELEFGGDALDSLDVQ